MLSAYMPKVFPKIASVKMILREALNEPPHNQVTNKTSSKGKYHQPQRI